ncbi:metallophosphoesterase [Chryseolinea sp. T2]|uniref:metallophosphoesterase n=1 Tax=Chryseolinea sp. T2 TaxID=3129255 RepID=UPI0030786761
MRSLLRFLLLRPILWLSSRFSSAPVRERVFEALSVLRAKMDLDPGKKGFIIPFQPLQSRFVIFSDQHKGARNGADDFALAEANYLNALKHYNDERFHLILLGDSEELWENTLIQIKKFNRATFQAEGLFLKRHALTKIFGNHDLDWEINPMAASELRKIYGGDLIALEGVILAGEINKKRIEIFCTHGHQGDAQSDGNLFSKFFVSNIWAPLQAYLRINPNTPAYNQSLKTTHNGMMYEWSSQQRNLFLITGHTHQPVFESLTHFERIQRSEDPTGKVYGDIRPCYFNTGCCCYDDGDITGIEISEGEIRLIKWTGKQGKISRVVLEQARLEKLSAALTDE